MQMQTYINEIRENGLTSEIIVSLLADYEESDTEKYNLYKRYIGEWSKVKDRQQLVNGEEKTDIINNKLSTNFVNMIVDTKAGYLTGKPISYVVDKQSPNWEASQELIDNFNKRTNVPDHDMESTIQASQGGNGARQSL